MPSGIRGGGGSRGSRGGGGRSYGGSSHIGGRSSSRSYFSSLNGRRTRIFIVGGRRYILPQKFSRAVSIMSFFLPIMFFVAFFSGAFLLTGITEKNNIEKEYVYYNKMITKAEKDSRYIIDAEVTGTYYDMNCGKWYYTYEFEMDNGLFSDGYVFPVYDDQQIEAFEEGQIIKIAVDDLNLDIYTDSVPMDFKNISIDQDGDYQIAKRHFNIGITVLCICGAGFIILTIVSNKIMKKHKQEVTETTDGSVELVAQKPMRYCEYCGSRLADNQTSCSSCGAKSTK